MNTTARRLCASLLVIGIGACGSMSPSAGSPTGAAPPTPSAQAVQPNRTIGPGISLPPPDLATIVLGPDEAPAGMDHDGTVTGKDTLTLVVISGRDAEFAALDGFVDGRATYFSGEAGALLTLALLFDSGAAGDIAFHFGYQRELRNEDGYGFGAGTPARLGFEGDCVTGLNPAHDGLEESICLWRSGPLILIAGGPLPMTQIREIAEGMDAAAHRSYVGSRS